MGAISYNQESGSLEIQYGGRENPFSGIDSSAPDPYISPCALTRNSSNAIVIDNSLRAIPFQSVSNLVSYSATSTVIGIGDLLGALFAVTYDTATNLVSVYSYPDFPDVSTGTLIGTVPIPAYAGHTPEPNTLTFKNINGVCYFSFRNCPYILQHNNTQVAALTTYLGCAFLNELNGRLVAADIFQIGSSSTTQTVSKSITAGGSPGDFSFNHTQYEFNSGLLRTVGSVGSGVLTDFIIGTNFGFNIPADATITGIGVSIYWRGQNAGTGLIKNVSLYKTNAAYGTPIATSDTNYGIFTQQPYGGSGILWGLTPAPSDINDGTFGVGFQIETVESGSTDRSFISSYTITIYYTTSSSSGNIVEYPYQFAWSAATQQYGQWSPLDANNLVTGAGFNNLPDVEDAITGYFNIGPTGYILRSQGITEVSPLNSGINPFDFNHLWSSHKGIGTIYSNTVAQYGSIGVFLSDTGIYSIGYEGINTLDNKAKSAIYGELVLGLAANQLCGGIGPLQIDGENFLCYMLAAQDTTGNCILYVFNFVTKEWYRFTPTLAANNTSIAFTAVNGIISATSINTLYLIANTLVNEWQILGLPVTSSVTGDEEATVILPGEEIRFMRDITIDAIGIYYNINQNIADITGTFSIKGTQYTLLNNTNFIFDGTWRYGLLYPIDQCYTGNTPQLEYTLTVNTDESVSAYIGKVILFGSIDSKQRPA